MKITARATALTLSLAAMTFVTAAPATMLAATVKVKTKVGGPVLTPNACPQPTCGLNDPRGCGIYQ